MFTASSTLVRAIDHYKPGHGRKDTKICGNGRKKRRYYIGNRTEYRSIYLKSDHWKILRQSKLKLNPCCEQCGADHYVEPHHINYRNLYDVTVFDLQTLCRKCHTNAHNKKNIIKKTKHKFKYKNIYRFRTMLIRKVAKITNIDPSKVQSKMDRLIKEYDARFNK